MAISKKLYTFETYPYRIRYLGSLLAVLITIQLFIRFWPSQETELDHYIYSETSPFDGVEEVIITTHLKTRTLVPSKPIVQQLPPEIKEEMLVPKIAELTALLDLDSLFSHFPPLMDGNGRIESRPDQLAVPLRIVEPELGFTLAEDLQGKIRIEVLFVVNQEGSVESVKILSISQIGASSGGLEIIVSKEQENLIKEAVQKAGLQWRFKPAEKNGFRVKSEYSSVFRQ